MLWNLRVPLSLARNLLWLELDCLSHNILLCAILIIYLILLKIVGLNLSLLLLSTNLI